MLDLKNEDVLDNLKEDLQKIKNYKDNKNKNNIFLILGMDDYEIRHSNMLRWLFDINITTTTDFHKDNLYDYLSKFISKEELKPLKKYEFSIEREKDNLDLLILFKDKDIVKHVFVIENKINASEGKNQLKNYREKIEKQFKTANKTFIFLRRKGLYPIDEVEREEWETSSYEDIYKILENNLKSHKDNLTEEEKLLTENYIELLEKRGIIMDKKYNDLLNKVYNKYSEEVNSIYDISLNNKIRMNMIKSYFLGKGFDFTNTKDVNFLTIYDNELQSILENKGYAKDSLVWALRIDNSNIISLYCEKELKDKVEKIADSIGKEIGKSKKIKQRRDNSFNIYGHKFYNENKEQKELSEEDRRINLIKGLDNFFRNEYVKITNIIKEL